MSKRFSFSLPMNRATQFMNIEIMQKEEKKIAMSHAAESRWMKNKKRKSRSSDFELFLEISVIRKCRFVYSHFTWLMENLCLLYRQRIWRQKNPSRSLQLAVTNESAGEALQTINCCSLLMAMVPMVNIKQQCSTLTQKRVRKHSRRWKWFASGVACKHSSWEYPCKSFNYAPSPKHGILLYSRWIC